MSIRARFRSRDWNALVSLTSSVVGWGSVQVCVESAIEIAGQYQFASFVGINKLREV